MLNRLVITLACLTMVFSFTGCMKKSGTATESTNQSSEVQGVEKVKPVLGKKVNVVVNEEAILEVLQAPVENIEVKLCEKFSRFLSGCGGKTYTAKTDKDGDYVITNVEPKEYEGLTVRVFDTDSYVFATAGIAGINAAKYSVVADKTLFVAPTHLFKGDLKAVNPKAGSTVSGRDLELKWDPYPDAAYYKFTLSPNDHNVTPPYVNQRVDAASFKVNKPLEKGTYRWKVEAYNGADKKLSESSDDYEFTIN